MNFPSSLFRFSRAFLLTITAAFFLWLPVPAFSATPQQVTSVVFAEMDGIIGVPMEEYVEGIFDSISNKNSLLIFKMDTPGGLVSSMSRIMSLIAEAEYPIVVWVAPAGASATSAGAFIVQAAHVAAMAPGTNIGAAHPVVGSGKDIGDEEMKRKVTNDLAAKIRSFAQERGRNAKVIESMVLESVSLTSQEALDAKVVDLIAANEDELLKSLDGFNVKIKGVPRKISLKNYTVTYMEMPLRLRLLEILSRPDFAYLALLAGVFLIILELRSPGGFVAGIIGAILLLLASYGLRVLPVNYAGVALLTGGIIIIMADLFIGGMGVISVAGVTAMLFGGLILFRAPGGELLNVSSVFIVATSLVIGAIFLFVLRLVYKALRSRPSSGSEGMVGERGIVIDRSPGKAMAIVMGEYWRVVPDDPELILAVGDEIEVVKVDVLTLYVKLRRRGTSLADRSQEHRES